MPEAGPDLAGEAGDRGLAVGAGHRDHARGLALEPPRREQREAAARILVQDQRHRKRAPGERRVREHRGGAPRHGIVDEAAPVRPAAGNRHEQGPGPDLARVGGKAGDLDLLSRRPLRSAQGRAGRTAACRILPRALAATRHRPPRRSSARSAGCGRSIASPSTRTLRNHGSAIAPLRRQAEQRPDPADDPTDGRRRGPAAMGKAVGRWHRPWARRG